MGTHKHFSWRYKKSLFFVMIQEVSARRVRKELINHYKNYIIFNVIIILNELYSFQ